MTRGLGAAASVLVTLAGLASGGAAEAQVSWREWDDGLQEARQLERPVLVDVCTRWSGPCRRMERNVYTRSEVREYLRRVFVSVRLDADATTPARYEGRRFTQRTLAAHFRVAAYPTTVFLRSDGEHLVSVPGYIEPDQFVQLLRYVGEGHLERGITWDEFRARQRR